MLPDRIIRRTSAFPTMAMQPSDLRAARKAMGLTQAELAEQLGLTQQFIGMMERG